MKKFLPLFFWFSATVVIAGCRPPVTQMPTQFTTAPSPPANVTCSELSLILDPALGSGFECETVPESSSSDIPMAIFIYPAHTKLILQDYPLTHARMV